MRQKQVAALGFEAFDETGKAAHEEPQGAFWGIGDQNEVIKYGTHVGKAHMRLMTERT